MINNFDEIGPVALWVNSVSHQVGSVFAARSTLRTVPLLSELIGHSELSDPPILDIIFPLWAMAVAHSSGTWPNAELPLVLVAEMAKKTSRHFYGYSLGNEIVDLAARAASSAGDAVSAIIDSNEIHSGSVAMTAMRVAYAFSDDIKIHSQHLWDAQFVEKGSSVKDLAIQPLWNGDSMENHFPLQLKQKWQILKQHLIALNQDWDVWIDWYEARLDGKPLIEEIEIGDPENGQYGRVTLPVDYYNDPAKANAAIKEIIEDYVDSLERPVGDSTVETPPQNPASIKPVIRNGKIYLSEKPLNTDLEISLAIENMLALRDEFEDFFTSVENDEGNFDQRPIDFLKTISALMPAGLPDSRTLFRLIRKEAAMEKYEATVSQQWPEFFADRYSSLLTELGQVLDQFPDRRAFQRQKLTVEIEDVNYDEFKQDFAPVMDAIAKENEIIDQTIPDAIRAIGETSDGPPLKDEQQVIMADQLDSTNNLLKALTDQVLDPKLSQQVMVNIGNAYGAGLVEGILEGAREAGIEDGKKVGASLARAKAAETVGKALYERYPERFNWLKRFFGKKR